MTRVLVIAVAALAVGCSEPPPLFGPPTGAVCPDGSTLTWDSFGRDFMQAYCTRCHAVALVGEERHGAPNFHDFDIVQGVRAVADHIDLTSAAGPDAINESMPPDGARPTADERVLLGQWLACHAP